MFSRYTKIYEELFQITNEHTIYRNENPQFPKEIKQFNEP